MLQKAYAEGLRALVLYTASVQDGVAGAEAARRDRRRWPSGSTTCCCRSSRASARSGPTSSSAQSLQTSAARASCRTTRSSSTSATRRSTPCTRAPRRSRAGLVLPQDRPRPGRGARRAVAEIRSSPRPRRATAGSRRSAPRCRRARPTSGHGRRDGRLPDRRAGAAVRNLQGRAEHHPAAAGARRPVVGWLLLRQAEVALTALDAGPPSARTRRSTGQGRRGAVLRQTVLPLLARRAGDRRGDHARPDGLRRRPRSDRTTQAAITSADQAAEVGSIQLTPGVIRRCLRVVRYTRNPASSSNSATTAKSAFPVFSPDVRANVKAADGADHAGSCAAARPAPAAPRRSPPASR